MEKNSKSCHDLDLGPAMPNIELVRDIFIYGNTENTETRKHRNTHTQTLMSTLLLRFAKNILNTYLFI